MTDSDITSPPPVVEGGTPVPEQRHVFEVRSKLMDEKPRYWTGKDFSPKQEEVLIFEDRDEAVLCLAGLRAGAYIVAVGVGP